MTAVVVRLPSFAFLEEASSILEALPDGLLVTDVFGRIAYANARMAQMSGYVRAELMGVSVELLVPERVRTTHQRQREGFSADPRTRSMGRLGMRLLRRDGSELSVRIQLSPLEIGGEYGVLAAVRDARESAPAEDPRIEREGILTLLADRERIASEVNAGVIHTLFGIGLHLQGAVEHADGDRARAAMERAVADLDGAITEVRDHIFGHRVGEAPEGPT